MNDEEIKKLIEETSLRDREYIKDLIEENREITNNYISQNKLESENKASEKRLSFVLGLFVVVTAIVAILGGVLPFLSYQNNANYAEKLSQIESKNSNELEKMKKDVENLKFRNEELLDKMNNKVESKLLYSEDKLDTKINDFNTKFDEITNRAYLKPKLICLYHGKDLSGQVINYHKNNEPYLGIIIKNIGDAAAFDMKIGLYYDKESTNTVTNNVEIKTNDPIYKYMQTYDYKKVFNAKEDGIISLFVENDQYKEVLCKLRIYYGQPEPLEYYFTVQTKE